MMCTPMWPFYSCMSLMIKDKDILQVDSGQRDTPGFGASHIVNTLNEVGYSLVKGQIEQMLSMEGFVVRPLTLRSIRGHDVLLDTTHDLLGING